MASSLNSEQESCYQKHRTRLIQIMEEAEFETQKARREYDEKRSYLEGIEKELEEFGNC